MALLAAALTGLACAAGLLGAPCDIYAAGGTPCVAAHSIVRPLFAGYTGPLFTVRRPVDNATLDISFKEGYADTAAQDKFCGFSHNQHCTLHRIWDQSPHANHLDPVSLGSRRAPGQSITHHKSKWRNIGMRDVFAIMLRVVLSIGSYRVLAANHISTRPRL